MMFAIERTILGLIGGLLSVVTLCTVIWLLSEPLERARVPGSTAIVIILGFAAAAFVLLMFDDALSGRLT